MTVELNVTSITVQPEISAANVVITPTFSSGETLTAPILSISKNGVNIAPDLLKNVDIEVPTATSDLTNDSNFVSDADYNHTDNNYDDAAVLEVAKIADKANSSDVTTALGSKADLVNGVVPSSQLPSYVDDVIEAANFAALPLVGESGKIYITQDDNLTYRWSGTGYAEISKSLALGETSGTAYRGDRGKTAYDHSQIVAGNPHGTTASDVGASALGHTHATETILPDAIKITKVYSDAEIAALAANTLFWDDVNQTYAFKLADGGVIQINQEPFDLYTNLEGSAINEMYVVSFCGASGNRTAVCLTDATDDTKSRNCFGMVTVSSIGINQVGRITKTGGKVRGLNTDVVGWTEGDTLYVHPTIKGTLTNVAPPAGTNKVRVGTLTVKHQNQGVIELNIHVESKLANLVDVDGTDTTILDTDEILKKDTAGLWKKVTWANVKTLLNSIFFSKTESDRRFVNQNGGKIYHITRWFTPTSAFTIAANGLSATITSGPQFTAAMIGAKLKLTNDVNEPIITAVDVTNRRITLSFAVDSSFFGQSVAVADWGVYNKAVDFAGGIILFYKLNDNTSVAQITTSGRFQGEFYARFNNAFSLIYNSGLNLRNDLGIRWSSTTDSDSTKDTAFDRLAAGWLKIYDGVTALAYRSLALLNISKTGYDYFAVSATSDTINDTRTSNVAGAVIYERCTGASATKGGGTWVNIFSIDRNGFLLDQYDDILPAMGWVDAAGGAAPDVTAHTIQGIAVNYKSFDGGTTTEAMTNAFEITHAIDIDALNRVTAPLLAEIHTHGMAATTGSGVVNIFYDLVYHPVNAAPIAWGTFSNLITINANEQYWHKLGGVELTKPSSGFAIGDKITCKYYRVPTDAQDTYTGDWLFMQCAMHMPLNSNGSRQRYVK